MSVQMKKTWFVDGEFIEQVIPESEIYLQHWSIEDCKAYAVQLRDTTRANTAAHAADAIEYLLSQVQRKWVGLTYEELHECYAHVEGVTVSEAVILMGVVRTTQAKLKEKNT